MICITWEQRLRDIRRQFFNANNFDPNFLLQQKQQQHTSRKSPSRRSPRQPRSQPSRRPPRRLSRRPSPRRLLPRRPPPRSDYLYTLNSSLFDLKRFCLKRIKFIHLLFFIFLFSNALTQSSSRLLFDYYACACYL